MSVKSGNGARPIVIGVTGHRNISANDPAIAKRVRLELAKIARAHKHAPLLILSGLAEGADRLVIKAAQKALHAHYWAILPLPDALYTRDFATARSTKAYKSLKKQAARVVEAPAMARRRALAAYGEPRNHQYAWVGAYIAKRAQVLLTIWDGAPARGTGGTAHVVDWFLADKTPRAYRISQAPKIAACKGVAPLLVHIDPKTHKVRRVRRRRRSSARRRS